MVTPASLPPPGLPGLDPAWSRLVEAVDAEGVRRTWHVLDSGGAGRGTLDPVDGSTLGTLLCVHGNPTWSYLWRGLLAHPPAGWRVVAVDQLGMGFSDRPAQPRTLDQRIRDLAGVTDALAVHGRVVTVAHDWGGPISLGWALEHRERLAGVVLTNTAVQQPAGSVAPALIRLARTPALRHTVCVRTPAFVRATTALSRPTLPADVRDAFAGPYGDASRRRAVGDFVADIPLEPDHRSAATLDLVAAGLRGLDVPALLLWGVRDPVFSDVHLHDLLERLPHADVHRYEGASHLVTEDAPEAVEALGRWVADLDRRHREEPRPEGESHPPVWAALEERAGDLSPAVVELSGRRAVSWDLLGRRVREIAAGLAASGLRRGQRVALLVPPGADLTTALYACWRAGAVVVVADAGLGLRALGRALRGAGPDWVIGTREGLAAARAMRVLGRRIASGHHDRATLRVLGASAGLADLARLGQGRPPPPEPRDPDECAVVFTSGATGPPKGVVYRHGQVRAQLAALRRTYAIGPDDRLVAAFAPFALYGPALGIASAVPATDVTAPATLTAEALADAVAAVDATLVFASPSALRNVVATAGALDSLRSKPLAGVRLVLSAGAPVRPGLLRSVCDLFPSAEARTPYGMTEALPVADVSLGQVEEAGDGDGVCVGRPVAGVDVRVSALGPLGAADGPLTAHPGVVGEICVRAAHVKDRYDRLWATERESGRDRGWHRTGDVGHLDDVGRLWVGGRLGHVVTSAAGVVTPVGVEQAVERLPEVSAAAAVGVGPTGAQQLVVVVVPQDGVGRGSVLAPDGLTAAVRGAVVADVAAVLVLHELPVDIRHNAKVDRTRVARWADRVLAGRRPGRP
ncbi:MAG TPA: alpha/beta fold hydrolase [Jiangellales bacterium]|nr:alpha/beta fold hydrolase [Jiangellales bacterium]